MRALPLEFNFNYFFLKKLARLQVLRDAHYFYCYDGAIIRFDDRRFVFHRDDDRINCCWSLLRRLDDYGIAAWNVIAPHRRRLLFRRQIELTARQIIMAIHRDRFACADVRPSGFTCHGQGGTRVTRAIVDSTFACVHRRFR